MFFLILSNSYFSRSLRPSSQNNYCHTKFGDGWARHITCLSWRLAMACRLPEKPMFASFLSLTRQRTKVESSLRLGQIRFMGGPGPSGPEFQLSGGLTGRQTTAESLQTGPAWGGEVGEGGSHGEVHQNVFRLTWSRLQHMI